MRFGRYEAVRSLGRGAMGEVFEAEHVDLATRVAVKVLHADAADGAGSARRMLREGRAAAAIRHPNVVTVLDVGEEEGRPFLVMELLEGRDLAQHLASTGPLGAEATADLVLPVVAAIAAAHDAGIVHRDIKPSNVFLARRRGEVEPVVVDFGICKPVGDAAAAAAAQSHPSTLGAAGTPQYMAPERFRGSPEATPASDQYALGVVLYECLTGGAPFAHEHFYGLLEAIMTHDVVAPSVLNPGVPAALDAVVLRALSRDPAGRFASVRALGAALVPFGGAEAKRRWARELDATERRKRALAAEAGPIAGGRSGSRRVALWLSPVALVVVAAVWLAWQRAPAAAPVAPAIEPLAAPTVVPLPPPPPASAAAAPPAPTTAAPPPPSPAPPQAARPHRVAAPAVAQSPAAPSAAAPAPAATALPAPSVERGTRNVPIVE